MSRIVKVYEKISGDKKKIEILQSAIAENQFSKALDMAKDALPESLLINGHSPILLLHRALSQGVHDLTAMNIVLLQRFRECDHYRCSV